MAELALVATAKAGTPPMRLARATNLGACIADVLPAAMWLQLAKPLANSWRKPSVHSAASGKSEIAQSSSPTSPGRMAGVGDHSLRQSYTLTNWDVATHL